MAKSNSRQLHVNVLNWSFPLTVSGSHQSCDNFRPLTGNGQVVKDLLLRNGTFNCGHSDSAYRSRSLAYHKYVKGSINLVDYPRYR